MSIPGVTADPATPAEQLETFDAFPALWVGEEFEGMTLYRVIDQSAAATLTAPAIQRISLIYSRCDSLEEGIPCRNDLQISIDGACAPQLVEVAKMSKQTLRGVDVNIKADSSIRAETDGFSVSVFAGGDDANLRRELALRAFKALRGANDKASSVSLGRDLVASNATVASCAR